MVSDKPSRTAMATALMRSLHTRADPKPLIEDAWGEKLLPQARAAYEARAKEGGVDADAIMHASPAYANVILRSRFAEDALAAACARGVTQYVLIGAGFDSFALRQPKGGGELTIFEVDHPTTQIYKLQRLAACAITAPVNVLFLGADLGVKRLGDVLAEAAFDTSSPAFFSWLGVTMYLTREANLATFREIARIGAKGSELVFTYSDLQRFNTPRSPAAQRMRDHVAMVGEPYICGFEPAMMAEELAVCGLTLVEDSGVPELLARYDPEGVNGLKPESYSRIARARVG